MKKLILALLVAGTVATANAQEPHSILLYGDASLATISDSVQHKTTNWDANIGIGYQFNQNWTLGLKLMWGQDATKEGNPAGPNPVTGAAQTQGTKNTFNTYAVGPFARYSHYFGKSEIFFWYGQFDIDYQGGYHTSEGNAADDKSTGIYAGIYPAIGINVHHGLALNFSVGGINYSSLKYTNIDGAGTSPTYATNSFNVTFGHQVNFGISKNFACHHMGMKHHHMAGEPGDEMHSRKAGKTDDDDDAPKSKKKERNRDEDE
jgi:hypothetical protein